MPETNQKPVIFLAFANDKEDNVRYLRNLPLELSNIRESLQEGDKQGHYERPVERANLTIKDLFDVFQDYRYRDRIAIFHYGGHADGYQLLLESSQTNQTAHGQGLVSFLKVQKGLILVFFNACLTEQQANELFDAGIPVVISTVGEIDDEIATALATRFYKGLGQGINIGRAWDEALAQIKTINGEANTRGLYRKDLKDKDREKINEHTSLWKIQYRSEEVKQWRLYAPPAPPSPKVNEVIKMLRKIANVTGYVLQSETELPYTLQGNLLKFIFNQEKEDDQVLEKDIALIINATPRKANSDVSHFFSTHSKAYSSFTIEKIEKAETMDETKSEEWKNFIKEFNRFVNHFCNSLPHNTSLHFFFATPVALAMGIGLAIGGYSNATIYHFNPSNKTYYPVFRANGELRK